MNLKAKVFDIAQSLEQAAGNEKLAKELFEMLLAELPSLLSGLKQAIGSLDWQSCWDHAHKIYGSTAYCGVPALRAVAQQLENSIKAREQQRVHTDSQLLEVEVNRLLEEGPEYLQQSWVT